MTANRTYRIESRIRGIEGPLTAAALVSMARAGLLRADDRIERAPGQWVAAGASKEIREAVAARTTDRRFLTSTSSGAAVVALRFAASDLVRDDRGRAVLLAVAAQHPAVEAAELAAASLAGVDPDGMGLLAAQVVAGRKGIESPGPSLDWQLDGHRKAILRALSDEAWDAFVEAARQVDGRGGLQMLWPNARDGEWIPPRHLFAGGRERSFEPEEAPLSEAEVLDVMLARVREEDAWNLNLSGLPISDLDALPDEVKAKIREVWRVDLSNTLLRSVPAWIFGNKRSLKLVGCPLETLPDLPAAAGGELPYGELDLDLTDTAIAGFPPSWRGHVFSEIALDQCPLHAGSFTNAPQCEHLRACQIGLSSISAFPIAPKHLYLDGNAFAELPAALRGCLPTIEHLDLDNNRLTSLPDWIDEARELALLGLARNRLQSLRGRLSALPSLQDVRLSGNFLSEVSAEVFADRRLSSIDLSLNRLSTLPAIQYPRNDLDLSDNPLLALPAPLNDPSAPEVDPNAWAPDSDEEEEAEDPTGSVDSTGDDEIDELGLDEESEDEIELELEDADEETDDDDDDAADDSVDESVDMDPYDSESEDPGLGAFSINASATLIETFPAELLDLKISSIRMARCPRLRSIPERLLSMPTLETLDCDDSTQLGDTHSPERSPWAAWPEARRAAVRSGLESNDAFDSPVRVDLCATAFGEVPAFLSTAVRPVQCDMSRSMVERWRAHGTRTRMQSMTLLETGLRELPALRSFDGLETLQLPDQCLRAIAPDLGRCTELEELRLPGLPESAYPSDLSQLVRLKTLRLVGPGLSAIPRFVATLPALDSLVIEHASVTELPDWLARCTSLREITITDSPLRTVHPSVLAIPSLREVMIGSRVIELPEFPEGCALEKLHVLDRTRVVVPASIARCRSLKSLDLSGAERVVLPESLAAMHWLEQVECGSGAHWNAVRAWLRRVLPALRT